MVGTRCSIAFAPKVPHSDVVDRGVLSQIIMFLVSTALSTVARITTSAKPCLHVLLACVDLPVPLFVSFCWSACLRTWVTCSLFASLRSGLDASACPGQAPPWCGSPQREKQKATQQQAGESLV